MMLLLLCISCDAPSPELDVGPAAEEEVGNSAEYAQDLIERSRSAEALSDEEVVMLAYIERLRLGLGSPFRLIEYAANDPRLSATNRIHLARILLARTAQGEAYDVESAALTWIGGMRPGVWHMHVMLDAMRDAADPRSAEYALVLAYEMAAAEGTVSADAPALAASAAALLRDRELSRRDAAAIYRAAEARGVPATSLVPSFRRERRLRVEQPAMSGLPPHVVEAAVASVPALYATARQQQELRRRFIPNRDDPIDHEPLLSVGIAQRLATLARTHNAPPQTPITTAVYVQHRRVLGSVAVNADERAWRERFVANATNEESFAAEHALLWHRVRYDFGARALTAVFAATWMRSFAQEAVWFPGMPGPAAKDLEGRFGLTSIRFEDDVPMTWRPYYRLLLLSSLDDLRTVLPHLSVTGLRIRIGRNLVRTGALATHEPRTRTLLLTPATAAGPLAHEIAHDLDWQLGRRLYGIRGYAVDRALRERGELAGWVRALTTDSVSAYAAVGNVERASEVFARNIDWLVMVGLATLGRSNAYLSSAQSRALPGYGSTTAPDAMGHAGTSVLVILDRYSPVAPHLRPALGRSIGTGRIFTPLELVTIATSAPARGNAATVITDVAPDTAAFAPMIGDARLNEVVRARDRALRALDHASCLAGWRDGRGTFRSNLRTLVLQAAAARARGAALEIAQLAGGAAARARAARAFYEPSSPYEPLDAADSVFVEQLIARANAVSDVEISAHDPVALFPVYRGAPWQQNRIVLFENVICRS